MTTSTETDDPRALADRLDWWGEDSDRLSVHGHVDLAEFRTAAEDRWRADGMADESEPFTDNDPEHVWLRDLTVGYAMRVYKVTPERAQQLVASDEHFEPCGPDDDGAQPYTVLDLDL